MPEEMLTWYWFLSVVVVGLFLNVASAYLKPALDAFFGFLSARSLNQQIKRAEAEMAQLDRYAKSDKAILIVGFKSIFVLLALVSLLFIFLTTIPPAHELFRILTIFVWLVVAAISITLADLFQKVSEYPKSREKIEKRIEELKKKLHEKEKPR